MVISYRYMNLVVVVVFVVWIGACVAGDRGTECQVNSPLNGNGSLQGIALPTPPFGQGEDPLDAVPGQTASVEEPTLLAELCCCPYFMSGREEECYRGNVLWGD